MVDETSIDLVIQGLKGLYEKLAIRDKSSKDKTTKAEEDGIWFDNEKDKCLQSLKELFVHRLKDNKEKRIKQNE